MPKPLLNLRAILDKVNIPAPTRSDLPRQQETAKPCVQKVICKTPRDPVNKQSALIVAPMRSWIYQPLADKPDPTPAQCARLEAQVKIEQNKNAKLAAEVGGLRSLAKERGRTIVQLKKDYYLAKLKLAENEKQMNLLNLQLQAAKSILPDA